MHVLGAEATEVGQLDQGRGERSVEVMAGDGLVKGGVLGREAIPGLGPMRVEEVGPRPRAVRSGLHVVSRGHVLGQGGGHRQDPARTVGAGAEPAVDGLPRSRHHLLSVGEHLLLAGVAQRGIGAQTLEDARHIRHAESGLADGAVLLDQRVGGVGDADAMDVGGVVGEGDEPLHQPAVDVVAPFDVADARLLVGTSGREQPVHQPVPIAGERRADPVDHSPLHPGPPRSLPLPSLGKLKTHEGI